MATSLCSCHGHGPSAVLRAGREWPASGEVRPAMLTLCFQPPGHCAQSLPALPGTRALELCPGVGHRQRAFWESCRRAARAVSSPTAKGFWGPGDIVTMADTQGRQESREKPYQRGRLSFPGRSKVSPPESRVTPRPPPHICPEQTVPASPHHRITARPRLPGAE